MKTIKVKFLVSGWVEEEIEIEDGLNKDSLEEMLSIGEIALPIQEGGDVILLKGDIKTIGKVISVDNNLEYEDFEVNYDD